MPHLGLPLPKGKAFIALAALYSGVPSCIRVTGCSGMVGLSKCFYEGIPGVKCSFQGSRCLSHFLNVGVKMHLILSHIS